MQRGASGAAGSASTPRKANEAPRKTNDAPRKTGETPRKADEKKKAGNIFFSGLKNFGIVFILCLVIFGLIATLAVGFVTSAVDDIFEEKSQLEEILNKDMEEVSAETDETNIPDGESFTVFIAVTDYDPAHFYYYPRGEALEKLHEKADRRKMGILSRGYKTITTKLNVIVRFDKERREYTITPVCSHTKVFTPSGYKQLGEVFYEFGPQYLVEKVSAITGIGIDYYMLFDAVEAEKIASALGGFNVEVSKDVYTDGAAFGTADRIYGDLSEVEIPETIPVETTGPHEDNTGEGEDSSDVTDVVTVPVTEEPETTEEDTDETEAEKEPREPYHLVCSAGTVTVNSGNARALLMFDDYNSSSSGERLQLEYQLVRGALLRLASMSETERMDFYDLYMLETSIDECSVTIGPPREAATKIDTSIYEDKQKVDDDKDAEETSEQPAEQPPENTAETPKIEPITDTAGYDLLSDNKISTDFSRKTAQLKNEMIEAAMRFPVKHLEFTGRDSNGFFIASNENSSRFHQFKMPPDPEKIVTTK